MRSETVRNKAKKELCALEIGKDGVALAHLHYPDQNQSHPILKTCDFSPSNNTDQLQDSIISLANKHGLKETACNLVLPPSNYRLILADTPNVPEEEYREALRWQIKDIVNYTAEDIALDMFVPTSFSQTNHPKIYVVAAQISFLQKIISATKRAELDLIAIDIMEFAVRNLLGFISNANKPIGFLSINETDCLLVIVKNRQIYFARRIPSHVDASQQEASCLKLSSEIQRSLDYYSNELKQDIPTEFFLPPLLSTDASLLKPLLNAITNTLTTITLSPFPINKIITPEQEKTLDPAMLGKCYLAIGGALRQNEESKHNEEA